jgi:hypothetical protein
MRPLQPFMTQEDNPDPELIMTDMVEQATIAFIMKQEEIHGIPPYMLEHSQKNLPL